MSAIVLLLLFIRLAIWRPLGRLYWCGHGAPDMSAGHRPPRAARPLSVAPAERGVLREYSPTTTPTQCQNDYAALCWQYDHARLVHPYQTEWMED